MRIRKISWVILGMGLLTLAGCGGGGGASGAAPETTVTVAPSLGRFKEGTKVRLHKLDGSDLVNGVLGADGKYIAKFSGHTGPVVVEVQGGTGVTYYDEGSKSDQPFPTGKKLRAVMSSPLTEVGVSALTNAAVVKLETGGALAAVNATQIDDANAKVAVAVGLASASILQAPTLVHAATGNTLNVANAADKYALVLAALAKAAPMGATAADVADAFAQDLKDDQLDQQDGSGTTPVALTNAPAASDLTTQYAAAASDLADQTSATVIASAPLAPSTNVVGVNATLISHVGLSKAMLGELRSTWQSFSNLAGNGFLDSQASRANADLSANIAPNLLLVGDRVEALGNTIATFRDAKAYSATSTYGFTLGADPTGTITGNVLVRQSGNLFLSWWGYGSFEFCWTDSVTPASITKVSCSYAGPHAADQVNGRIRLVIYEVTSSGADSYAYTATRRNKPVLTSSATDPGVSIFNPDFSAASTPTTVPPGSGTLVQTNDASGKPLTLSVNGTLPPSGGTPGVLETGVDTIAISATRSLLSGNNYRYALQGAVSTSKLAVGSTTAVDTSKTVTLKFDTGSYIDADESNAFGQGSQSGAQPLAAKLIGVAETTQTRFTGTIDMGAIQTDVSGYSRLPANVGFTGVVADLSAGGAGAFLTGQIEATVTDYNLFNSMVPESSANYMKTTATFTGTVQAPSRPALQLVVAASRTGFETNAATLTYRYGSTVNITGTATWSTIPGSTQQVVVTNQDGIQLTYDNTTGQGTVTKAGATLATIANGVVNYTDGVSESLN